MPEQKVQSTEHKADLGFSDDLDVDGVYDEWVAIVARQMKEKASKAAKEKEKAFL